jgi:hypothetical protein
MLRGTHVTHELFGAAVFVCGVFGLIYIEGTHGASDSLYGPDDPPRFLKICCVLNSLLPLGSSKTNEMNVQQLRQCEWIIKNGHFRAVEYKDTTRQARISREPIAEARTPRPTALNQGHEIKASRVSPKTAVRCADGFIDFCLICYIRSVDWICCN